MNKKQLKVILFHLKGDDLLGTYATVISLISQNKTETLETKNRALTKISEELNYLQQNFRIVPRSEGNKANKA